ncbi:MAG: hypothetical protein GPJ54_05810 [Candidatus Heimdallarchaeota archaeon]|nr:hypothetical protein [Candidatus Heimdallarchaeota archaeon]
MRGKPIKYAPGQLNVDAHFLNHDPKVVITHAPYRGQVDGLIGVFGL